MLDQVLIDDASPELESVYILCACLSPPTKHSIQQFKKEMIKWCITNAQTICNKNRLKKFDVCLVDIKSGQGHVIALADYIGEQESLEQQFEVWSRMMGNKNTKHKPLEATGYDKWWKTLIHSVFWVKRPKKTVN